MTRTETEIQQDILENSGFQIQNMRLLRSKDGVSVYKCTWQGASAVVKHFENEGDRREIQNYRMLQACGVETIPVLAYGAFAFVMQDIATSERWRLGAREDLQNPDVARGLAGWYFDFHEKGQAAPELGTLYCEYEEVTQAALEALCETLPEGAETLQYVLAHYQVLQHALRAPAYTLTYNDFYWTNLVVGTQQQEAMMFDYNYLGKGFRYSDIRNVCNSLSESAGAAFAAEYARLYAGRHGVGREQKEAREKQVDEVVSTLFTLVAAYRRETFPGWAARERDALLDGSLLQRAKELLG